jgi:hypothetical protein
LWQSEEVFLDHSHVSVRPKKIENKKKSQESVASNKQLDKLSLIYKNSHRTTFSIQGKS